MAYLGKNRRAYFFATQLLVLIYIIAGFYPFHLKTPPDSEQINGAIALPDQGVVFRAPGIAYTEWAPPAIWVCCHSLNAQRMPA